MGWDILNGIPVVGHVKGAVHLAKGDKEAAKKALIAANRSSAVITAGALASVGGPVVAAGAAVAVGALCDATTTVASKEPQGVIKGIKNIHDDMAQGKAPIASTITTGLLIGSDALGGLGGDALANAAVGTVGQEVSKAVSKEVVLKTVNVQTGELITKSVLREAVSTGVRTNAANLTVEGIVNVATSGLAHETASKGLEKIEAKRRSRAMEKQNYPYRNSRPFPSELEWSPPTPEEQRENERQAAELSALLRKKFRKRREPQVEDFAAVFEKEVRGATSSPNIILAPVEAGCITLLVDALIRLFDVLNGVPLIGHAKGGIHIFSGDKHAARRAVAASTRSTIVVAAGALGTVHDLRWAAVAAIVAGSCFDLVATLLSQQPQGVLSGVANIRVDISMGKVPLGSTFATGAMIVCDVLSGFGGCMLREAFSCYMLTPSSTLRGNERLYFSWRRGEFRSLARIGSRWVVLTGAYFWAICEQSKAQSVAASGAGASPPDPPGKRTHEVEELTEDEKTYFQLLLDVFGVDSLDKIVIRGVAVFQNLAKGQKNALKYLLSLLKKYGIVGSVVRLVVKLFESGYDVSFDNFLSLANLVATWFGEAFEEYGIVFFNGRNETLFERISEILRSILRKMKSSKPLSIKFRDAFTAAYHYLKHRRLPSGVALTVEEYFNWIKVLQARVSLTQAYTDLVNGNNSRCDLQYEVYYSDIGRRALMKLKTEHGKPTLLTFYFVDEEHDGDEDGDEYIDKQQL